MGSRLELGSELIECDTRLVRVHTVVCQALA